MSGTNRRGKQRYIPGKEGDVEQLLIYRGLEIVDVLAVEHLLSPE